ncbi:MAG: glycosyltransferase [Oscillospiraceae bacterium]|nr:glycosyltransferase [Oscillospiraceae bacterium]
MVNPPKAGDRLNVLYLINYAGKAGTEKYVENLIRLGRGKINPFFAYNIDGELSRKMSEASVPSLQLEMSRRSLFTAAKKLAEFCRINSIDVIHAQYPRENIVALISKRYYDKPRVVMTNHLTLRLSGLSGLVWQLLNRHFTPKNHRIIAVCNEGREIMIANGVKPERIAVIFNGIEPAGTPVRSDAIRREFMLPENCFVMTILARLAPEKGLSFLLDCLAELKNKTDKPFVCLICGDGELLDEIKCRITELNLENECRLLGFRKDTREILLGSDIYLCSSSRNEAMSFAILEAMNAGLPLVVTDVGGNRDLAETGIKCGFVSMYGDTGAFSDNIRRFMDDPALRDGYAAAAVEKIERYFDLNKLADDVFAGYK